MLKAIWAKVNPTNQPHLTPEQFSTFVKLVLKVASTTQGSAPRPEFQRTSSSSLPVQPTPDASTPDVTEPSLEKKAFLVSKMFQALLEQQQEQVQVILLTKL